MHDRMAELKKAYNAIPVPKEMYEMVERLDGQHRPRRRFWVRALAVAAGALVLFTVGVNALPAMAESLERVPVLGPVARALTIANYRMEEQGVSADINVIQVTGLENKELEDTINADLRADSRALVKKFYEDVADLKARNGDNATAHIAIETYYDVKCSNDEVFSLQIEFFWAAGGSDTYFKFYNVNQKTGELLTLGSLFRDETDGLNTINDYLIERMKAETGEDGKSIYWVNDDDPETDRFVGVGPDHNFYINEASHLVIAFDKYEVAPGYVGTPEFEIPTELIAGMLAADAPVH